jgi:hypothetical protein
MTGRIALMTAFALILAATAKLLTGSCSVMGSARLADAMALKGVGCTAIGGAALAAAKPSSLAAHAPACSDSAATVGLLFPASCSAATAAVSSAGIAEGFAMSAVLEVVALSFLYACQRHLKLGFHRYLLQVLQTMSMVVQ